MPGRDAYHDAVRHALISEGWTITHDPYNLFVGAHNLYVDLGAERLIAAVRDHERIAVEVKSFLGASEVTDLERALGQYLLYRSLLRRQEPERILYLAIPARAFRSVFSSALGATVVEDHEIKILVFDPEQQEIQQWLPETNMPSS